jgi:hypothetical protein
VCRVAVAFIGIDPGASGGMACIYSDTEVAAFVTPMPGSLVEVLAWFVGVSEGWECKTAMEKVGGYVGGGPVCPICKQRKNLSPGSSMFKFGEGVGTLKMAVLAATGREPDELHPNTWEPEFVGKGSRETLKSRLKAAAVELFPDVRGITLKTADALLLAEYCRRKFKFVSGARRVSAIV